MSDIGLGNTDSVYPKFYVLRWQQLHQFITVTDKEN